MNIHSHPQDEQEHTMNSVAIAEQSSQKPQTLQTASRPPLNTGYYDLLAQIALTHKRSRSERQA